MAQWQWPSMAIYGYLWLSMAINGYLWQSLAINGYQWLIWIAIWSTAMAQNDLTVQIADIATQSGRISESILGSGHTAASRTTP